MKSIVRRTGTLLIALLFVAAASGSTPKRISEEEAKQAGLAFLNRVFDASETEATVKYVTEAGYSYTDGEIVETGKEEPVSYYVVTVSEYNDGRYRYYAQVNAETGVAYYAGRSTSFVPEMTAEQQKAFSEAKGNGDWEQYDYSRVSVDCRDTAREWIAQTFDLKAKILGFIDGGFLSDDTGTYASFYVVIRDGTIYYVNMLWPQRTVLEVGVLNQIGSYWSEP